MSATPGSGAVGTVLAEGTLPAGLDVDQDHLALAARAEVGVVTQSIVIEPKGHTGWHTHSGPAIVTVMAGALTLYEGQDPVCPGTTYEAGETFVDEGAGHVHIGRNDGDSELSLFVTYLVPAGEEIRIDSEPGTCPESMPDTSTAVGRSKAPDQLRMRLPIAYWAR